MNKLEKALSKLSANERNHIEVLINQLASRVLQENADIKKLKGAQNVFRIRKGRLRIMYREEKEAIEVLEISLRSEKTYRNI